MTKRRILLYDLGLLTLLHVVALLWCHFNTTVAVIETVISGVVLLVGSWGHICRCKIRKQYTLDWHDHVGVRFSNTPLSEGRTLILILKAWVIRLLGNNSDWM